MADEDNPFAHLHAGGAVAEEDNPFAHLMASTAPAEDARDIRARQATEKARGIQAQQPGFNPFDEKTEATAQQQGIATQLQPNDLQFPSAQGAPMESAVEATNKGGRLQRMMSAAGSVIHAAGIAPPEGKFGAADVSLEGAGKTELGKGGVSGAASVAQIAPAFEMLGSSNAMKWAADQLEQVNNETSGPYAGYSPEQREGARQQIAKTIAQSKDTLGASLKVWQTYAAQQQANTGRVPSITDVRDAADFKDWLAHTAGSGIVSLAPIIIASLVPMVGGVAAGAGITAQTIAQEAGRTAAGIAPAGSALESANRDPAAEAHAALQRDQPAIAGASLVNTALNFAGPVGKLATGVKPEVSGFIRRTATGAAEQAAIGAGQTVTSALARGEPVSGKDVAEQVASGLVIGGGLAAGHEPPAAKGAKPGAIPPAGGRIEPTMGELPSGPSFSDVKSKMKPDPGEAGAFITPNGAQITPDMWDSAPADRREAWLAPKSAAEAEKPTKPTQPTEKGRVPAPEAAKPEAKPPFEPSSERETVPPAGEGVPKRGTKVTEEELGSTEGQKPPPKVSAKGLKTEELPVEHVEGAPVEEKTPETVQAEATSAAKEGAESRVPVAPGEGIKAERPPEPEEAPISRQKSPLLKGLSELGLHPDTMSDLGVDAGRRRIVKGERTYTKAGKLQVAKSSRTTQDPMIVGGRKLFREGGKQIDEVVGHLQDEGYMPQDYERDWGPDADHAKAEMAGDIVRRELDRPGSVKKWADEEVDQQHKAGAQQQEQADEALRARAEDLGIEHKGRDINDVATAVTDAEHRDWLGKNELDELAGERAQRALVAHSMDAAAVRRAATQHENNPEGFHAAIDQILSAHASQDRGAPGPAARAKRGAEDHGRGEVSEPANIRAGAREGVSGEANVHAKDQAAIGAAGRAYSRGAVSPERAAGAEEERAGRQRARPAGESGAVERRGAASEAAARSMRLRAAQEMAPEATRRALAQHHDNESLDAAVKKILTRRAGEAAATPEETKAKLRELGYTDLADFEPTRKGGDGSARMFARGGADERQAEMFPVAPGRGSELRKGEVEVSAAPGVVKVGELRSRLKVLGHEAGPVTVRKLPLGEKPVRSVQDVANILAPLRRQTQEHFLMLVTDKNDRPVAVIRHSLGGRSRSQIEFMSALGSAGLVEGAHNVWPAHNHPGGEPNPSSFDTDLQQGLSHILEGTGLNLRDHTILTPHGAYAGFGTTRGGEVEVGATKPIGKTRTIPVLEREFTRFERNGPRALTSHRVSKEDVPNLSRDEQGNKRPGVVLIDSQAVPVGFLPMSLDEMMALRSGNIDAGAMALLRSMELTGASSMVAHLPMTDESKQSLHATSAVTRNLSGLAYVTGAHYLDTIVGTPSGVVSLDEKKLIQRGGSFMARGPQLEQPHSSPEAFRAEAERAFGKAGVAALEAQNLFNLHAARELGQEDSTGRAFYDPGYGVFLWDKIPKGQVAGVIAHEIGVHHGMRAIMGDAGYDRLIADMKSSADPEVKAAQAHVAEFYEGSDFDRDQEVLARLVETAPQHGIVQRIVDAVRSFLYRNFGVGKFDQGLARALAASAIRATVHGDLGGSPHFVEAQAYARDAGAVDPGERDMTGPGWYSELGRQIDAIPSNAMKPGDWAQRIGALKGVKAEEIRATGLSDWLKMQPEGRRVPRQEVSDWVRNNGPKVEEIQLGERHANPTLELARSRVQDLSERIERHFDNQEQAVEDIRESIYQTAYRPDAEMAITTYREGAEAKVPDDELRARANRFISLFVNPKGTVADYSTQRARSDSVYAKFETLRILTKDRAALQESLDAAAKHFNEQSALAGPAKTVAGTAGPSQFESWKVATGGKNYREIVLTTPDRRNPADVEKVRRVQQEFSELASGHLGPEFPEAGNEIMRRHGAAEYAAGPAQVKISHFQSTTGKVANNLAHMRVDERTDGDGKRALFVHELQSDWAQRGRRQGFGVFDVGARGVETGPYVTSTPAWAGLAIRRLLRYAVANGHERLLWTHGDAVSQMFGLQSRIKSVRLTRPTISESTYFPNDGKERYRLHVVQGRGAVTAMDRFEHVGNHTHEELREHIGTALADSMVQEMLDQPMAQRDGEQLIDSKASRGNRKFYDEMLPKIVEDELRQMGDKQRVRDVPLAEGTKDHHGQPLTEPAHGIDITPQIRDAVTPGVRQYARGRKVQQQPKAFDEGIKPQTKQQKWEERLYNSFNRVFQAHEQVEAQSKRPTGEAADMPLAVQGYAGKLEDMGNQIRENYLKPLAEVMDARFKALKLTGVDLSNWLYAVHAPVRNAYIGKLRGEAGGWSGMTDEQAAAIRDKYSPQKQDALRAAAEHVYAMNDAMLQRRVDTGLITQAVADNVRAAFGREYVPLRDLDMEAQQLGAAGAEFAPGKPGSHVARGTGQGFELTGSGLQTAFGRKSRAGDPLINSIQQAARAAVMGEKAMVDRSIWNFAQIPEAEKIITPVDNSNAWKYFKTLVYDPATDPMIKAGGTGQWANREEVVRLRVDGETKYVLVRDQKLRDQLRNATDAEAFHPILEAIGRFTHGIGRLLTEYNPSFTIPNAMRDAVTAVIRAGAYPGVSRSAVLTGIGPAYLDIIGSMRGDLARPGAAAFEEFQRNGGMTGAYGVRDAVDIYRDLESMGAQLGAEHGRNIGQRAWHETFGRLGQWLSTGNQVVEYATRLSFYKELRAQGVSPARAAVEAKKITINFNQHGTWGRQANRAFVFTNAALQSVYGAYQYAKAPSVRRALYAMAATAIATELWNWYVGGVDPDTGERNITKVAQGKADSSMILLYPNSDKGLSLPLPQEYGAIWALPRHAVRALLVPASERWTELSGAIGALLTNIVPTRLSDQASSAPLAAIKSATPTLLGAPVDVLTDENFFGAPIYSKQTYQDPRAPLPYWAHARPSTSDVSRGISEGLNWATGGDAITPGKAQDWLGPFMAPESMDYMLGSYAGGVGILAAQTTNLVRAAVTGDTDAVELRRLPVLGRLAFTNQNSYVGRRYNDLAGDYIREKQYQTAGTDRPDSPIAKTLDEFEAAEAELRPLFRSLREATQAGAKEEARAIRDEIRATQSAVLKAYNEARQ